MKAEKKFLIVKVSKISSKDGAKSFKTSVISEFQELQKNIARGKA